MSQSGNVKKILCCNAVLITRSTEAGSVSNIPNLRNKTQKLIDFVKEFDPAMPDVAVENGKKGLALIGAALSDMGGRLAELPDVVFPQKLVDKWTVAADKVLHPED
jgi:hypothetical protein